MDSPNDNHVLTDITENGCSNFHTHILCKPSVEAFEAAIRIANVDPKKTVRLSTYLELTWDYVVIYIIFKNSRNQFITVLSYLLQIFFDDSVRNVASAKVAGLHTVIVSSSLLSMHFMRRWKKLNNSTFLFICYAILQCNLTSNNLLMQLGHSDLVPGADHALNSIHNIKEALPEIWEIEEGNQQQKIQPPAVETMVLA